MSEAELLAECREALGYTGRGLAKHLALPGEDRRIRRWENGEQDIPSLLWMVLFYMLRENGKRELMNRVHSIIVARRTG